MAALYPKFVQEQMQVAQGFSMLANDLFFDTYDPGWRNHLDFS